MPPPIVARSAREGAESDDNDVVVTAGYMKKLGPATLTAYDQRIFNIHPALLPKYGGRGMYGLHVHRAVLAAGEMISGASVHLVTAEYDEGPIVARREVPVFPGDDPESLAERVLAAEHILLPSAIRDMAVQSMSDGQQESAPAR
ncbi:hypothetical protein LDL08_33825 [Nonomuraea glycinis]|uniref:phosphoribosylglycinamide formyltransferase 1 n=1 Tax=Nonomuraea glycinis TaxID=2047744 RepID=A0A918ABM0_9ACTN|nr:formyltransferase family protein [Nonomuraea glycinis]MCA2181168.1 hypothetical protein [Nonomuraea glycinis]GGP13527.1 hypothetical protein GCM10012278_65650 [Nonomuraea glycinis]